MPGYDRYEVTIPRYIGKIGVFGERELPTFASEVEVMNRGHHTIRNRGIETACHLFLQIGQVFSNVVIGLTGNQADRTDNAVRAATKTSSFSPPIVLYKFQHCARPTLCISVISKYHGGWINSRCCFDSKFYRH